MHKLAIGLLAATLALAACGGSSKKSVNPAAGGTTASGGSTTTSSGSGNGSDDLSKLAGEYAKAKIKITYASNSGSDASSITIAQDGTGKSAFTTDGGTFYSDGKSAISCTGTGAAAECIDFGSLGGGGANLGSSITGMFSALASLLSTLGGGDKSSESIAGRDASCVTYKASDVVGKLAALPLFKDSMNSGDYDPTDSATICVDKETGFLLKISGTKKGKADDQLIATEVGEPSASDFVPPATPQTVPSLPGGVTIPSVPSP